VNFFVTITFPQVQGVQQSFQGLRFALLRRSGNFALLAAKVSQSMEKR